MSPDLYFAFVSALQYVFVRNYTQNAIIKRVSLLHFPTCMTLVNYKELYVSEEGDEVPMRGGEQVLAVVGTKEGKVLFMKIASNGYQRLAESRGGLAYGAITAIDVSATQDKVLAGTQSGEIFSIDILTNIEEEEIKD